MLLFRHEVLESRTSQWIGSVRLSRPLGFGLVTLAAAICLLLFVALLSLGTVSRKARLHGTLVPIRGTLQLTVQEAGIVAEIKVLEGAHVKAGQSLAIVARNKESLVDGNRTNVYTKLISQVHLRRQSVSDERTLKRTQAAQKVTAIEQRLAILQGEFDQARMESELVRRKMESARNTADQFEALSKDGFVSRVQVNTRREEVLEMRARLKSLARSQLSLERELLDLNTERSVVSTQLQSDLLQVERAAGLVEQELIEYSSRNTQVITAPFSGKITALNVESGRAVSPGQSLMALVPSDEGGVTLEAQLAATSKTVGLIEVGQEVHIRYAAFPFQKYGSYSGYVHRISSSPVAIGELEKRFDHPNLGRYPEPMYRVNVRLRSQAVNVQGRQILLKPGFVLEADVIEDTSTLLHLLLGPLLAARAHL